MGQGAWVSPDGNFQLSPDLNHPGPKGPHWSFKRFGQEWECYKDKNGEIQMAKKGTEWWK